jgi:hypothetical protein
VIGKRLSIYIGFDPRETAAFAVARNSIKRHTTLPVRVNGLVLSELRDRGLYTRPHEQRGCQLWDVISDAPCATEFSNSRFLVPHLAKEGFALFMDCDMLVRKNLARLFALADTSKAVQVVKHNHQPTETTKMDGQIQTRYGRKNWSSVILWNCDHPANKALTLEMVNGLPGRDLHRFCWLEDDLIGELPVEWNWLAGHSDPSVDPAIVHHTDGIPSMPGYENAPFADEWRAELTRWAA